MIRTFEPYTLAQCMVVEPYCHTSALPPKVVLKLADPRFSAADAHYMGGLKAEAKATQWTEDIDRRFKDGLACVRNGSWRNYWKELGASERVGMWDREEEDCDSKSKRAWMREVDWWISLRATTADEAIVYRRLQDLQGAGIPRLFGTCAYHLEDASPTLDPFVATAPGLLLEYIEGVSMDRLKVDEDISFQDARRASRGALAILRKFRDRFVSHGDFADRNVVVRLDDPDHPVIIDLGSAHIWCDEEGGLTQDTIESIRRDREIPRARQTLSYGGFHVPSPAPEEMEKYQDRSAHPSGFRFYNQEIERMRSEWRELLYEPVYSIPPPRTKLTTYSGKKKERREPLLWRIKDGVQTAEASADYCWGKPRYGWSTGPPYVKP